MFKAVYFLNAVAVLSLTLFGSFASATMVELWGGDGVNIQVYDDHAFLLFDCANGHSTNWNYNAYPLTAIEGTVRSEVKAIPYPREMPAKFSASLASENELLLTVEVPPQAPSTYVLHRNVKPTFHSCEDQ